MLKSETKNIYIVRDVLVARSLPSVPFPAGSLN